MTIKDVTRSFKRSRLFTTINIIGLAIGIAVSIMLILFVIDELSYDKHFKDADRIVSLNTLLKSDDGNERLLPICTRRAITDIPSKITGIEAATQIYRSGENDLTFTDEHFKINMHHTDASFFEVFQIPIIEGDYRRIDEPNTLIITDKYAKIIFGNIKDAINKTVRLYDNDFTIVAIVKELPNNTHFSFDALMDMGQLKEFQSIEFFTFYKIAKEAPLAETRKRIEDEYTIVISEFLKGFSEKGYGATEKLTDIYLHSKATSTLGKRSNMNFVWLLSIVSLMILSLAITNFVNLYISQSEARLLEIGIRKANGANRKDLIKRFFAEIAIVVLLTFAIGTAFAITLLPHFGKLIDRSLDVSQIINLQFLVAIGALFAVTVILSAAYPAFYLSRFNTLEILAKQIQFSKKRLAGIVVVFQAIISIILLSFIFVVNAQTAYLKSQKTYYNPKNVMIVTLGNRKIVEEYATLKQELLNNPQVLKVSTAGHIFGGGVSGQTIAKIDNPIQQPINEYRVNAGICEIMELELIEGAFFKEEDPRNASSIVINEATVNMLGLSDPVIGTIISYKGNPTEVIGAVSDFIYESPQNKVNPLALTSAWGYGEYLYIKLDDNVSRTKAREIVETAFHKINSESVINTAWAEDVYLNKFNALDIQSKILLYATILSILISTLGLLATQSYTATRRTKEIALRRINGASAESLFFTLSSDMLKWMSIASFIGVSISYFVCTTWLEIYSNRTSIDVFILAIPVLLLLTIALVVTSGITLKVISQNPVKSLKSE